VASAMNGRNTSGGNQPGHWPSTMPAAPNAPARNPSGTEPTSPRNIVARGLLTARNGRIAAASARNAGTDDCVAASLAANPYAAKPMAPIVAANPSIPSMKLYRFADHAITSAIDS